MLLLIICGTVPAAVVGFLAQKTIETTLRSPFILSITLIGVALLLWLAERIARREKDLGQVSLPDALSIGSAQALALIPGTSRSGITIATGLVPRIDAGGCGAIFISLVCTDHRRGFAQETAGSSSDGNPGC